MQFRFNARLLDKDYFNKKLKNLSYASLLSFRQGLRKKLERNKAEADVGIDDRF